MEALAFAGLVAQCCCCYPKKDIAIRVMLLYFNEIFIKCSYDYNYLYYVETEKSREMLVRK